MSGKVSCGKVVASKILPRSKKLQIGNLTWPTEAPKCGTVMKTSADGSLVFEPSNVRAVVDPSDTYYGILPTDDIVAVTGSLDTTLKLPDPKTKTVGDLIYIVKEVAGASAVTVVPYGTELISGRTSAKLLASYGSFKLYTNGTNYFALY